MTRDSGRKRKDGVAEVDREGSHKKQVKEGMVRAGRRTAKAVNYDERATEPLYDQDAVTPVDYTETQTEREALTETESGPSRLRRLYRFEFFDDCGVLQPLESPQGPHFLRGVVQPLEGKLTKKTGRFVPRFGPIVKWTVLYSADTATVQVFTNDAEYRCCRPSLKYQPLYAHLQEQITIAHQIYTLLAPGPTKGDSGVSFDTVLQRLQRSKVKHGYCTWRDAISANAAFLLQQLPQMNLQHENEGIHFEETPFGLALQQECGGTGIMSVGGGIVIQETGNGVQSASTDELFARQLQAKEEAKLAKQDLKARLNGTHELTRVVLVSEEDIADDYPEPVMYEKLEEETDEFLMAEEDVALINPESLPQRILTDFDIYNPDGMLKTLELLPCWSGLAPTVELYGSGVVREEEDEADAEFYRALRESIAQGGSSSAMGGASGSGACSDPGTDPEAAGMRIFLSQIQEYVVECGADSVCISIRTEASWYKLQHPSVAYAPWFNVVVKCARITVKIISMLLKEARASKLSLSDVTALLAKEAPESDAFVARTASEVKRWLMLHGQFILNQFAQYPDVKIQNCAFASQLKDQLLMRHNCRSLLAPKKDQGRHTRPRGPQITPAINKNPMKDRSVNVRAKSLPAAATVLIEQIWKDYFSLTGLVKENGKTEEMTPEEEETGDLDVTDGSDPALAESRNAFLHDGPIPTEEICTEAMEWTAGPVMTCKRVSAPRDAEIKSGDVVICLDPSPVYRNRDDRLERTSDEWSRGSVGMVNCFLRDRVNGELYVQLRSIVKGTETVLGDAAAYHELFLTDRWAIIELKRISLPVKNIHLKTAQEPNVKYGVTHREPSETDAFVLKLIYQPEKGMFQSIRDLNLGELHSIKGTSGKATRTGENSFSMPNGVYNVGDTVYFDPSVLEDSVEPAKQVAVPSYILASKRDPKGSVRKMKPYGVGKITALTPHHSTTMLKKVMIERYYRPEDIDEKLEATADFWEVYCSSVQMGIRPEDIIRKCSVQFCHPGKATPDTFVCTKKMELDENGQKMISDLSPADPTPTAQTYKAELAEQPKVLRMLDIFAGCGGLSEGMHQAGVAETHWAIEYDDAAAEAFRQNHPSAAVLCCNVSALLCRLMSAHGHGDHCCACPEVEKQAATIADSDVERMPLPGEVDFMVGGPPCQGYSGMNRFNKSQWSTMQNSMVMNYLSFADYYRPRYFLLENVRNFVSHNSSRTFRLTLRSLIEMGYQVRFGVLNAGNYGVPQSRKRTFIWGALPEERLPDWPSPLHVFHSPQLAISLPGGIRYAVEYDPRGAPLRTVTVQDAISDLPPILNGADQVQQEYGRAAVSAFQRKIRGGTDVLMDHICKRLNELNLERCRCIPRNTPGADWRTLLEIVARDPSRTEFQGQPLVPWCLPNTAARHNNWRGLFGRLDKRGHFPTSTTDPQPMGKVGQGFPDRYRFYGTIHQKHKQVGNAVPPPLAYALGTALRRALDKGADACI